MVESLKRLYFHGEVSSQKLNSMLKDKKISKEEYEYIINK